jgi:hypothetical protein
MNQRHLARAAAANAMAEATQDPRDRACWRSAAAAWEYLAGGLKAATARGVQLQAQRRVAALIANLPPEPDAAAEIQQTAKEPVPYYANIAF